MKDFIEVPVQYVYNDDWHVPSFEVRRCELFAIPMLLVLKKAGQVIDKVLVPPHRLNQGIRTGIIRRFGNWRHGNDQSYEILVFRASQFRAQELADSGTQF